MKEDDKGILVAVVIGLLIFAFSFISKQFNKDK
jgi:tetrahydromethanopterin S-methyltransferase subunit G